MNTSEIYTAIGQRVDDPDKSSYSDRYENVFVAAMIDLIKARDENGNFIYSPEEYPDLSSPQEISLEFSDGWAKKDFERSDNIIFIRDLFIEGDSRISAIAVRKDYQNLAYMMSNIYLKPSTNEFYWTIVGNTIYVITGIGTTLNNFKLDVVKNPDPSDWGTSHLNYGRSFLEGCITRAASILRQEIGLE